MSPNTETMRVFLCRVNGSFKRKRKINDSLSNFLIQKTTQNRFFFKNFEMILQLVCTVLVWFLHFSKFVHGPDFMVTFRQFGVLLPIQSQAIRLTALFSTRLIKCCKIAALYSDFNVHFCTGFLYWCLLCFHDSVHMQYFFEYSFAFQTEF